MQLAILTSRDQGSYRKTVFIPYVNPRKCSFRAIWRSVPHQCLREKEARTLKLSLHEQTNNKTDLKCSKLEEQQVPQHLASSTCHSEGMKHATLVKPARVQPSSRCLGKSVRTKQRERDCPGHFSSIQRVAPKSCITLVGLFFHQNVSLLSTATWLQMILDSPSCIFPSLTISCWNTSIQNIHTILFQLAVPNISFGVVWVFFFLISIRKYWLLTEKSLRSLSRYRIAGLDPKTIHVSCGSFSPSKHRKLELKAESQRGRQSHYKQPVQASCKPVTSGRSRPLCWQIHGHVWGRDKKHWEWIDTWEHWLSTQDVPTVS